MNSLLSLLHHCLVKGLELARRGCVKAAQSGNSEGWRVPGKQGCGEMTVIVRDKSMNQSIKMKCPPMSLISFHSPRLALFLEVILLSLSLCFKVTFVTGSIHRWSGTHIWTI
jgi:hypothetical protein